MTYMATLSEIRPTEKECVERRYFPLESENSTCAAFHSHLSNGWALVWYYYFVALL